MLIIWFITFLFHDALHFDHLLHIALCASALDKTAVHTSFRRSTRTTLTHPFSNCQCLAYNTNEILYFIMAKLIGFQLC
jgi:hypothetical protein